MVHQKHVKYAKSSIPENSNWKMIDLLIWMLKYRMHQLWREEPLWKKQQVNPCSLTVEEEEESASPLQLVAPADKLATLMDHFPHRHKEGPVYHAPRGEAVPLQPHERRGQNRMIFVW